MRSKDIRTRQANAAYLHQGLTDAGCPRRLNGQKLGLRRRLQLWKEEIIKMGRGLYGS